MNSFIETLNLWGERAIGFAWPMLWQSSLLIAALFAIDFALRRRVRAAVRHALWLVVLLKLLLPPSLALPTSLAWWLPRSPQPPQKTAVTASYVVTYGNTVQSEPLPIIQHTEPPAAKLSRDAWLLAGWAFGSVGLFGFLLIRWRQMMVEIGETEPAPDWADGLLVEVQNQLNWRRSCRLRLTRRAMSPAVCGFLQPTVLLPRALTEKLQPAQLRAVLLHELIHLRRGDVWVNCGQALLQIFYWWHPLLWFANARIRRVREEAVDDAVMLALRDDGESYAPTLLEVAKLAFSRPLASLGLVGIMESRSALRQRIERLTNSSAPRKAGVSILSLAGIAAFTALALPMGEAPVKPIGPTQPTELASTPPAAPSSDGSEKAVGEKPPFEVQSGSSSFDTATGILTATGGVVIKYGETVITADSARINQEAGEVVAEGNARVQNRLGDMAGDRIRFDSKAGRLRAERPSFHAALDAPSLAAALPTPLPTAVLAVDAETKEATVNAGEAEAWFTFNLTNTSSSDVVVTGVVTSCGCTVAKPPALPWVLTPGANGQIPVVMKLEGKTGTLTKTVTLNSDKGPKTLTVKATILPVAVEVSAPIDGAVSKPASSGKQVEPLYTRTLKFDPEFFLPNLQRRMQLPDKSTDSEVIEALPAFLADAGLELRPPCSLFLKERGLAMVRAPRDKIEAIEKLFTELNDSRPQSEIPAPGPPPDRETIMRKLDQIRFDSPAYNETPLIEVVRNLSWETKNRDPEGKGFSFRTKYSGRQGMVNLSAVKVTIAAISNVRLSDLLDAIIKGADKPIQYHIWAGVEFYSIADEPALPLGMTVGEAPAGGARAESLPNRIATQPSSVASAANTNSDRRAIEVATLVQDGSLFYQMGKLDEAETKLNQALRIDPENKVASSYLERVKEARRSRSEMGSTTSKDTNLFTRTFKVDPKVFIGGLVSVTGFAITNTGDETKALTRMFSDAGVVFHPPKALFFNRVGGTLLVRATLADLDVVEKVVVVLNQSPPQVNIKVKFVEIPEEIAGTFAVEWFKPSHQNGIITEPQMQELFAKLKKRDGVAIISGPEVTTLSGRQAQIQMMDMKTIVTGLNTTLTNGGADFIYQTKGMPFGPVLDVIPNVSADGYTIQLTATTTVTQFLGYDDPREFTKNYTNNPVEHAQLPLPRSRVRQITTSAIVWDGQTLVLGNFSDQMVVKKPDGTSESKPFAGGKKKQLFVFITPTIIDPAGNRVHTDEDMPLASKSVPPQKK